jgi:hypothetical protein
MRDVVRGVVQMQTQMRERQPAAGLDFGPAMSRLGRARPGSPNDQTAPGNPETDAQAPSPVIAAASLSKRVPGRRTTDSLPYKVLGCLISHRAFSRCSAFPAGLWAAFSSASAETGHEHQTGCCELGCSQKHSVHAFTEEWARGHLIAIQCQNDDLREVY